MRADWTRRLGGYLIDAVLVAVVTAGPWGPRWLSTVVAFGYQTIMVATRGRTIGQTVVHVRVTLLDGSPPPFAAAAIRAFVPALGSILVALTDPVGGLTLRIAALIAAFWGLIVYAPVFGRESRGWHDRASGTEVLVGKRTRQGS